MQCSVAGIVCRTPVSPDKQTLVTVFGPEGGWDAGNCFGSFMAVAVNGDDEVWGKEKNLNSQKTPRKPGLRAVGNRSSFNYFLSSWHLREYIFSWSLLMADALLVLIDWSIDWVSEFLLIFIEQTPDARNRASLFTLHWNPIPGRWQDSLFLPIHR